MEDTLTKALRILARDIVSEDGVASVVILQAADEIERLRLAIRRLADQDATLTDAEREPLAYAVLLSNGRPYQRCDFEWEAQAISAALLVHEGAASTVAPLYRSPALTDAEREAVERAAAWMVQIASQRGEIYSAGYLADDAATLRGLLERTK